MNVQDHGQQPIRSTRCVRVRPDPAAEVGDEFGAVARPRSPAETSGSGRSRRGRCGWRTGSGASAGGAVVAVVLTGPRIVEKGHDPTGIVIAATRDLPGRRDQPPPRRRNPGLTSSSSGIPRPAGAPPSTACHRLVHGMGEDAGHIGDVTLEQQLPDPSDKLRGTAPPCPAATVEQI